MLKCCVEICLFLSLIRSSSQYKIIRRGEFKVEVPECTEPHIDLRLAREFIEAVFSSLLTYFETIPFGDVDLDEFHLDHYMFANGKAVNLHTLSHDQSKLQVTIDSMRVTFFLHMTIHDFSLSYDVLLKKDKKKPFYDDFGVLNYSAPTCDLLMSLKAVAIKDMGHCTCIIDKFNFRSLNDMNVTLERYPGENSKESLECFKKYEKDILLIGRKKFLKDIRVLEDHYYSTITEALEQSNFQIPNFNKTEAYCCNSTEPKLMETL